MLANIGIMLGAYVGFRLFERYKSSIKKTPRVKDVVKDNGNNQLIQSDLENTNHNDIEKECNHYYKVSAVALGLTTINYFILFPPLTILSVATLFYVCFPILKRAENALLNKRLNNEFLTATVNILTFAMVYYPACALQALIYHLGHKMVYKSKDMSTKMLTDVFVQQPSKVWILQEHIEIEVPLEALKINDVVVVKTGEVVPIDGIIVDGMATIDQHALTGEAVPAEKSIGEQVFAATIIVSGKLHIKVEKTGVETTVAKLGEILSHTADFKTSLQLKGEELADKAATPLLVSSVLSAPFLGMSSATAILFSAPVNTIRAQGSLHTFNHLSLIASKGILVKDGRALERLTKIDTVLFDKTGTLTHGQPEIGQIILCGELGEDAVLTYAAAAEHRLTHPIAHAILQKAAERQLRLPDIENANYKIGYGLTVTLNNQVINIGSARFIISEGITLPTAIEEAKARSQTEGYSLIMVAVNHQLQGAIEIRPQIRPEVKQVIKRLRQRGIQHIAVVSGDYEQPTQKLAQELGLDSYYSEVLPQDKANLVEQLRKEGRKVCFVGDGINDVIAMKKADVSISLRGASSIATDMAQVVLMDGSLSHLEDTFAISSELNVNLRYNLLFWAGYGTINIVNNAFLGFGITKSMWFFAIAFGFGTAHAMHPLKQLEHKKKSLKDMLF